MIEPLAGEKRDQPSVDWVEVAWVIIALPSVEKMLLLISVMIYACVNYREDYFIGTMTWILETKLFMYDTNCGVELATFECTWMDGFCST